MLSDRQAEIKSAIAIIRPISLEVEDMLGRMPKLLRHAQHNQDQVEELARSLDDVRSRLMDLDRANREYEHAMMIRQEVVAL